MCHTHERHHSDMYDSAMSAPEKTAGERKSRIHNLVGQRRESGDGMDESEMAGSADHRVLRVSHLMSQYEQYHDSSDDITDEHDE